MYIQLWRVGKQVSGNLIGLKSFARFVKAYLHQHFVQLLWHDGVKLKRAGNMILRRQKELRHVHENINDDQVFNDRRKGIGTCELKATHDFNFNCTTVSMWCVCGNKS